jgi:uncharacterized membrane protein
LRSSRTEQLDLDGFFEKGAVGVRKEVPMWFTVSFALLVVALVCCIFTAAKGEARLPLWVSVLLVILALLVTHVPVGR